MATVNVLHIASFEGNIGDNANHAGTRQQLARNVPEHSFHFTELEIREFFWKQRSFDSPEFVQLVNQHDLVLFGGGNFFELWVPGSCNGTSVDIPLHILEQCNTPFCFYALGMDPGMGAPAENIAKFKAWLDYLLARPQQFLISLRNDGALETAHLYLGQAYAQHMHPVPDGGFFLEIEHEHSYPEINPAAQATVGIQLAGDMPETRFQDPQYGVQQFVEDFAGFINALLDAQPGVHLCFFSHIYKDVRLISQISYHIKDWHLRRRITFAPYLHGFGAEQYVFGLYRRCALILGNRFHANVCAIGQGVPTIGLFNYRQIEKLYQELGRTDRLQQINTPGYAQQLLAAVQASLQQHATLAQEYATLHTQLQAQKAAFHKTFAAWLSKSLPS